MKKPDAKIAAFELSNLDRIQYRPLTDNLLSRNLQTHEDTTIIIRSEKQKMASPESIILEKFRGFDIINYDENADLINQLVMQVTRHLATYLDSPLAVQNVCNNYSDKIAT